MSANSPTVTIRINDRNIDISDIVQKTDIVSGPYQPFPTATVTVDKAKFASDKYWKDKDAANDKVPDADKLQGAPDIKTGETTINIVGYGSHSNLVITNMADQETSYTIITATDRAYKLKTTTVLSLCDFTVKVTKGATDYAISVSAPTLLERYNATTSNRCRMHYKALCKTTVADNPKGEFRVAVRIISNYSQAWHKKDCSPTFILRFTYDNQTPTVEYITGSIESIIQFLGIGIPPDMLNKIPVKTISFNNTSLMVFGSEALYDLNSDIKTEYTQEEIGKIKENSIPAPDWYYLRKISPTATTYCWDVIQNLCASLHCHPFIDDDGQLTCVSLNGAVGSTKWYQTASLKYGEGCTFNTEHTDLTYVVANKDQGTKYLRSSQSVISDTYKSTVNITDSDGDMKGPITPVYYPTFDKTVYPYTGDVYAHGTIPNLAEDYDKILLEGVLAGEYSSDGKDIQYYYLDNSGYWASAGPVNQPNNIQKHLCNAIALNLLAMWYHPQDCVSFQISEMNIDNTPVINYPNSNAPPFNSYAELVAYSQTIEPTQGDYAGVLVVGELVYYKYDNGKWVSTGAASSYKPFLKDGPVGVRTFEDKENSITLKDVAIAQIERIWPNCVTTMVFGNPELNDTSNIISNLEKAVKASAQEDTLSASISDSYLSKLVVGNQTLGEVTDTRKNFSGFIIEKNLNSDLYRMAGYDTGVLQTSMDSKGTIVAGANLVRLNEVGITVGSQKDSASSVFSLSSGSYFDILDSTGTSAIHFNDLDAHIGSNITFDKGVWLNKGAHIGEWGGNITPEGIDFIVKYGNASRLLGSPGVTITPPGKRIEYGTGINAPPQDNAELKSSNLIGFNMTAADVSKILLSINHQSGDPLSFTITYGTSTKSDEWPYLEVSGWDADITSVLKTLPYIDSDTGDLVVPDTVNLSCGLSWTPANEGSLNESIQVTVMYKVAKYSATYNGTSIDNISLTDYEDVTVSGFHSASSSNGSCDLILKIPSTVNYSPTFSGATLNGTVPCRLNGIRITVKFSLAQTLTITRLWASTISKGSFGLTVAHQGAFANSFIPGPNAALINCPSSQLMNYTSLEKLMTFRNASSTTDGIKDIYVMSGTSSTVPSSGKDGDICLIYRA